MAIRYAFYGPNDYAYLDRPWERAMKAAERIEGYEKSGADRIDLFNEEELARKGGRSVIGEVVYYDGRVLATGEHNWHDDSDFYAVCWDDEKGIVHKEYDTTRFAGGGRANIDATDEVKEKAGDHLEAWYYDLLKEDAKAAAKRVEKDKKVKVVRGRKVPKGTEGLVIWAGERHYGGVTRKNMNGTYWSGGGRSELRIGIATDDEKETIEKTGRRGKKYEVERYKNVVWTTARNVEVVNPEEYETPDEELKTRAKRVRGNFRAKSMYASARAGMIAL
jgi:hypothetical protein